MSEALNDSAGDKIVKIGNATEAALVRKLIGIPMGNLTGTAAPIYVHRIVRYFIKAFTFAPAFKDASGVSSRSEDYKPFTMRQGLSIAMAAALNSSLFYWYWRTRCDGFHCGYADVYAFPFKEPTPDTLAALEVVHGDL